MVKGNKQKKAEEDPRYSINVRITRDEEGEFRAGYGYFTIFPEGVDVTDRLDPKDFKDCCDLFNEDDPYLETKFPISLMKLCMIQDDYCQFLARASSMWKGIAEAHGKELEDLKGERRATDVPSDGTDQPGD
jgi:hypothetical protein